MVRHRLTQVQCYIYKIKESQFFTNIYKYTVAAYSIYILFFPLELGVIPLTVISSKRLFSLSRNIVMFLREYASHGGQPTWEGRVSLKSKMHSALLSVISSS